MYLKNEVQEDIVRMLEREQEEIRGRLRANCFSLKILTETSRKLKRKRAAIGSLIRAVQGKPQRTRKKHSKGLKPPAP